MSAPRKLDANELRRHALPEAKPGDKDERGIVLIIAGSRDVPGAPLLSAHGAMRAGAGKLQIATPREIAVPLGIAMPEAMVVGCKAARDGGFAKSAVKPLVKLARQADAVVAGPAMYGNSAADELVSALCELNKPLALDAALLHALSHQSESTRASRVPPVLLPHDGEMASLLGCTPEEVASDRLNAGRTCAAEYDSVVVAKGPESFVVAPDGMSWVYSARTPGLAISGSGDVLAGILAGLMARGASPLDATLWAVWLHGQAGSGLAERIGPLGFLARELPSELPKLLSNYAS